MADSPAAGWYEDPYDPMAVRYWDGSAWTSSRAQNKVKKKAAQVITREQKAQARAQSAAEAEAVRRQVDARKRELAEKAAFEATESKKRAELQRQEQLREQERVTAADRDREARALEAARLKAAQEKAAEVTSTTAVINPTTVTLPEARVSSAPLPSRRDVRPGPTKVGILPSDKAWRVIKDHCSTGEEPWLVIGGTSAGGVLAAFDDRLMIVKTGLMTSFMSGSLGGARITTFPFTEITGIEYNSGMLTGVLEVLTPSYSGSGNKDFWRGTNRSRNSDSNDPYTLSNTLPLLKAYYQEAIPHINRIRKLVVESKRPQASLVVAASSVADEIGKLASLRDSGVLTDSEFAEAKAKLLTGRQSS